MNRHRTILVVGGGAAGLMAALFAVRAGADVTLLERNEKLGKKIYITGKGRGNLTNTAEREEFLRHVLRNPRFLYAALAKLDNAGTMELFESLGISLKEERGGRVFPASDHASDITLSLKRALTEAGAHVRLHARVARLLLDEGRVLGVELEDGEAIRADRVILATGGVSYPSTGSTGDGHKFAAAAGHSVTTLVPALTGIETRETWPALLSGLSLKNVRLSAFAPGGKKEKLLFSELGEMLFTHFGISGPLALTLSSLLPEDLSGVRMSIDLKPALDAQTVDRRLVRNLQALSRKQLISVMDGLVPHSLGECLLELARISPALPANAVTQAQRREIVRQIKALPLTPSGLRPFSEAIVTRGGISVREVDPSTMASRRVQGLYFAGELLDLDATTGGYNLQIAFSTGALAGASAAADEQSGSDRRA